jgi:hypothetical protein
MNRNNPVEIAPTCPPPRTAMEMLGDWIISWFGFPPIRCFP